ncbi:MAG: ATP-binding protein [Chlorobiales bacterium]|nr:ATP-binding protein [Chlorobiales bacterium]
MLTRNLEPIVKRLSREYPAIAIVGPRQSGKTTLAKKLFPGHTYLSLENLDLRQQAENDPRGFLNDHGPHLILDEVQRVPALFSYLQEKVDADTRPARYILTGSQQFLLMEKISQSLAGRIIHFKLFPFTVNELYLPKVDSSLPQIFHGRHSLPKAAKLPDLASIILTGFYPRIHDRHLTSHKWLENYVMTYVERDIRSLINISDLRVFENFLKICAAHSGQLINFAAISNAVGISQPTVKKWLSLLETSGIIFLLQPHHQNFTKRIVKSPKLFFIDTGLLCFLLSIKTTAELKSHPLYGHVFETFILSEFYKRCSHVGEIPPIFFWRDKLGNEIDLLAELGSQLLPIEIKSSQTYSPHFEDGLKKWFALKGNTATQGKVIYAGTQLLGQSRNITALPWWAI